jgi:hypothetical protein
MGTSTLAMLCLNDDHYNSSLTILFLEEPYHNAGKEMPAYNGTKIVKNGLMAFIAAHPGTHILFKKLFP